jgi:hypothetical protein
MRINKHGGGVDIFEFDCSEWSFRPKWHDLAAIPVSTSNIHSVTVALSSMLLRKEFADDVDVGPGDDVFMVGRFMDHDGGKINEPAVRFGHISMSPTAIKQPTGSHLPSYVIDVHSRTGYSGSPVFAYRTIPGINHLFNTVSEGFRKPKVTQFMCILGIMWGYFPELWEISSKKKPKNKPSGAKSLSVTGNYVEGMSGMTCVVPAWAILELLDHERIKEFIRIEEDKLRENGVSAKAG